MPLWSRVLGAKSSAKGSAKSERVTLNHDKLGSVTLSRSVRARRISISVRVGGEVRLTMPLRGDLDVALRFLDSPVEWVLAARAKMVGRVCREFSSAEIEELRCRAKEYLPSRVAEIASRFGFDYGRLSIRASRTKWGSCSGVNNISLSLFLMRLPLHLIDFVIIHELCHTVHHDHSRGFHELVDRCTGGRERVLQRELKDFTTTNEPV